MKEQVSMGKVDGCPENMQEQNHIIEDDTVYPFLHAAIQDEDALGRKKEELFTQELYAAPGEDIRSHDRTIMNFAYASPEWFDFRNRIITDSSAVNDVKADEKKISYCTKCGNRIQEDENFCIVCGKRKSSPVNPGDTVLMCRNCHSDISPSDFYCPYCGAPQSYVPEKKKASAEELTELIKKLEERTGKLEERTRELEECIRKLDRRTWTLELSRKEQETVTSPLYVPVVPNHSAEVKKKRFGLKVTDLLKRR